MPGISNGSAIAILAAGNGRRLGQSKPMLMLQGQTLLQRAIAIARGTAAEVWITLGVDGDAVWASVPDHSGLTRLDVADAATGQSASLRAVVRHAQSRPNVDRLLVLLVDQFAVDTAWLGGLLDTSVTHPERVVTSVVAGLRGAPTVFPRSTWSILSVLSGDTGARDWLRSAPADAVVDWLAPGPTGDVDHLGDLPE